MPLNPKGQKILSSMQDQYGDKKGKSVFYASINAGRIKGVEGRAEGGAVDRLSDRSSSNIEDRRAEAPLTIGQWIAANNPYLPRDYHLYRGMPQAVQRQAPTQYTQARAEGGIVDHDQDEHLPRAQDDARLVRMESAPSGEGPMQLPPGYMAALLRLLRKQQAELYPFYRAWRGGFVGWR